MKTINLEKISKMHNNFINERDWEQFHSVKNLSMAMSVECSELVELFQWQTEQDSNSVKEKKELKEKVEDEVADVFLYLIRLSEKCDIDIEGAVLRKIEKNSKKYPVEKSRGSSKKYTQL